MIRWFARERGEVMGRWWHVGGAPEGQPGQLESFGCVVRGSHCRLNWGLRGLWPITRTAREKITSFLRGLVVCGLLGK